jgi:hypothetical protein
LRLEQLSARYGVSRERVRQIEIRAFEKVRAASNLLSFSGEFVAMLDKEPVGTFLAFSLAHPCQDPAALQLLALESEVKLAFPYSAIWILTVPIAAIPNHHGAAAVLPLRNGPFEVAVIQRMVFLDREPLVVGSREGPFVTV